MKMTKSIRENDLLKRGIEILSRELGKYDAIRFLAIPREKSSKVCGGTENGRLL